jgi:hypothetical protein
MTKKQTKKKSKTEIPLEAEDSHELQMILDRLAVQDPNGQSLEGYLSSLLHSLRGRPGLAAALIGELSKNPTGSGFRTYVVLKGTVEASPSHRRALKQAAYRFAQRGFAEANNDAAAEKVVLIQKEARQPAAHFLPVEGTLWFVTALFPASTPSGGSVFVSVFAEEGFKSAYVRAAESSGKVYREYIQSIAPHLEGRKICEIPVSHAARLFFDIVSFCGKEDASPELALAQKAFTPYYDPGKKPYAYELLPEIGDPERRIPEMDIEKLLSGEDLSWLRFAKDGLAPFHQKIQELDSPILVVPREIQIERSVDVIRSAADALCTGKVRLFHQRFFEERAMFFKLSGKDEEALWAWIVAQHLAGGFRAGENPAVFQIAVQSLRHHWPEEFKKTEEEEPKEPFRRTESGIILP